MIIFNIFLLLSVAIEDHRSPKNPLVLVLGNPRSSSGKGLSWNDADRSVSKNDSRISSASTTMRKLYTFVKLLLAGGNEEGRLDVRREVQIRLVRFHRRW